MEKFISWGERRINLGLVKEYKPIKIRDSFSIKLIYLSGVEEELTFGTNREERDQFLLFLDENFLKPSE